MMFENEISVPGHRDLFFYENTADIYAAEDRKSRGSTAPGQVRAAGCGMSIQHRDPHTLRRDNRILRREDMFILNVSKDLQWFLLTLLFLAGNKGDDVSNHLRPGLKVLSGPGDRLIGTDVYLGRFEFLPRSQGRYISLDRAVWLDGDEPAAGSQSSALVLDDLKMLRVDLRNHHGDIFSPSMSAVISYDYITDILWDLCVHLPSSGDSILISLTSAALAGSNSGHLEPGMSCEQSYKPLTYHSGTAKDSHS